jgi:hypothetical protein
MESMLYKLQFGGNIIWIQAVLLACLMMIKSFRPESIRNVGLFGAAGLMLLLSIVLPAFTGFFIPFSVRTLSADENTIITVLQMSGPIFLGLGFYLGFLSLSDRQHR